MITHPVEFRHAVDTLSEMIRAVGGVPVLYKPRHMKKVGHPVSNGMTFDEMQQKLTDVYRAAAEANHALLAPIGQAFAAARSIAQLYDANDHYHPSVQGYRLAAEVIASVIRGNN